jgi:hypothetical protein
MYERDESTAKNPVKLMRLFTVEGVAEAAAGMGRRGVSLAG